LKHQGKICIVGYIEKRRYEFRPRGFYAAIGPLKLFSFGDAYCLGKSTSDNNPRQMQKRLNSEETRKILKHFKGKVNILDQCRTEVERLKKRLRMDVRANRE